MEQKIVAPSPFLTSWNDIMLIGTLAFAILTILVYILYQVRVSMFKDPKEKYDYVNSSEIAWFKRVFFFLGLSIACAINLYGYEKLTELGLLFFVRLFFSIACATLISYVAALILQFYYPTKLNFKLRKLRYTPRINPKNGNKMRLLSEEEEDVHLNEGMQAEENIFSIDD